MVPDSLKLLARSTWYLQTNPAYYKQLALTLSPGASGTTFFFPIKCALMNASRLPFLDKWEALMACHRQEPDADWIFLSNLYGRIYN